MRYRGYRLLALVGLATAAACGDDRSDLEPALTGLVVAGTKTPLNPVFEPHVFRYSVVADDEFPEVTLTPLATQGMIVAVNGDISAPNTPYSLASLTPGDVVQIEVQAPGRRRISVLYEVLYLPADFPELAVTVLESAAASEPLYVTLNGPGARYVAILDNHGVPTFFRAEERAVFDFKWHAATGERSYLRLTGTRNQWGRRDAEAVILDPSFTEMDRITTVDLSHTDIHDFLITRNGELILIAYEGAVRDLTYLGLSREEFVEESVIQVLDRTSRQVRFQWSSWQHVPFEDQTYPTLRGEYAHVNSVIEDVDGNLIISASGTSQVIKIARPSGQVVWKLGGKSNEFEFSGDPFPHLCGQHAVSRLENGNLLFFDNGRNCWPEIEQRGELTRVVEYRIDEPALEAELVWSYSQAGAFSRSQGSAQRLANGNTLIGWGSGPGILATEVSAEGEKVFEITAQVAGEPVVSYRVRRYPR
jgi:hypothetical protein